MSHARRMPLRRIVLVACMMAGFATAAHAQAVWLKPHGDQVSQRGFVTSGDYRRLFEPGAQWQQALRRLQVFGIGTRFAATAPEQELRSLFVFLRSHNIGLTVELHSTPARSCGRGVEGMIFHPHHSFDLAMRLRRLGANLTYISLDEPLHFGHYYHRRNACAYTIDSLAAGVAESIRQVKQVFPGIKVVDVEPLTGLGPPAEIGEWIAALGRNVPDSAPIAIIFDVQWNRSWQGYVRPTIEAVRYYGLDYGVIFNGTFKDRTDEAWMASAQSHVEQWHSLASDPPAYVVIESWNDHPTHVLPESDPTALTFLVNWYCARPWSHCAVGGD